MPAARVVQRHTAGVAPLSLVHCCPCSLTWPCGAGPPCAGSACGLAPPSSLGLHELIYVQDVDGSSTMTASVRRGGLRLGMGPAAGGSGM